MENSSTEERNPTLVPFFFADCVNIHSMAFSVGKTYDICTSAESLVVCSMLHGTALTVVPQAGQPL